MHDTDSVIKEADAKFAAKNLDGARIIYQSALLDWVDDAREGSGGEAPDLLKDKITTLWIAYANLNKRAKMFKSATEAYEAATSCPVAGTMGSLWLEYARFQEERGRHRTAQNVYLRALVGDDHNPAAVKDEPGKKILWNEFVRMMKGQTKNPSLTLQELRDAVENEHVATMKSKPSEVDGTAEVVNEEMSLEKSSPDDPSTPDDAPPSKRAKLDDTDPPATTHAESSADIAFGTEPLQLITAKEVEAEATTLVEVMGKLPPELRAAWFARDGDSPPFRPEPPLFTPSPPKFSDASGKDILGDELALNLIRILQKNNESDQTGSTILDVCQACWIMTAINEKEASKALQDIDQKMIKEKETLELNLEARASVAGGALSAVQQINESERNDFISKCNQQRQQLHDYTAWQFRELLAVQQQLLTKVDLPGFDGPTVDASVIAHQANVCSFLHSAFYLRTRIGEKQHLAMLKSQEGRLSAAVSSKKAEAPQPAHGVQTGVPNTAVPFQPQTFQPQHPFPPAHQLHAQPLYQQHGVFQQPPPFPPPPPGQLQQQAFGAQMVPMQGHVGAPVIPSAVPMQHAQGQGAFSTQHQHNSHQGANYR
mmetsp:Transcript_38820/g.116721  ORF Transcript_38820/g.116721 Transcript_38820/m.116721 type:complete len:598 (-) Transcript_38820:64-1857(-)